MDPNPTKKWRIQSLLTQPNYGNLIALLPGVQHPPDMNKHLHPQISGVIRV
jgi:hypothetical protein